MMDEPADRPDITLTLDRDGVIRNVAPSNSLESEAIEDWRGRPWGDTVPPELVERVAQAMEASRESGESLRFRVQQLLPSGRELPVEYTTVSLGKNAGFVAIGRNLQTVSDLQGAACRCAEGARTGFLASSGHRATLSGRARRLRRRGGAGARLQHARRRSQCSRRARAGAAPRRGVLSRSFRARPQGVRRRAGARGIAGPRAQLSSCTCPTASQWSLRASMVDQRLRRLLSAANVGARRRAGIGCRARQSRTDIASSPRRFS